MGTLQQKTSVGRSVGRAIIMTKLALVATSAAAFVALPQLSGTRAGGPPNPPIGILFTVTTLDDHNDFSCDSDDCTLAEAIDAANNASSADTIDFSVTGTINLTSALSNITDDLEITGPGAEMLTVRRADSAAPFSVFVVTTSGKVTFSGLTINNGVAGIENSSTGEINVINCGIIENDTGGSHGGGIYNNDTGTAKVIGSTISGNHSDGGGGIVNNSSGTVTVHDSTISDNIVTRFRGGGIFNNTSGMVSVTDSTISGNSAGRAGGGIYNESGQITVINSSISSNSADDGGGVSNLTGIVSVTSSTIDHNSASSNGSEGGGIDILGGTVSVTSSLIHANSAESGGGIANAGTLNLTNSTVSNNFITDKASAGGIYNVGTATITNCTITGNATQPTQRGTGGVQSSGTNASLQIKSTIIALNIAISSFPDSLPDVSGAFTSAGFNLIGKTDGSAGFTAATDLTGTIASPRDPGLDPNGLQDNGGPTQTVALICGSAAIDKGTSIGLTGSLMTDQRGAGFPRTVDDPLVPNANDTQGDGTDIGAFELNTQNCNHPPVAQCKNIQLSANSNCQASITASAVDNGSFDPDKGDSIATRTLDSTGPFALGQHTVMLTVTDTHGASSSCSAMVTVIDTTPPTLSCPANPNVPAAQGQCQAVVTYANPTVTDNCQGAMLLGCVPPSGSTFQVGTTPVTCTAKDEANNSGTCQFLVIVFDNQPPSITCSANVTALTNQAACPTPACKVVTYPAPVLSDNCPGVTVVCTPPAGSCFPTGVTTVNCTAADTGGNTATCSFTVTVFDAALQDDGNPSTILLWNSITGSYRFCCNGVTFTGMGKSRVQGCVYTLEHNPADRRVLGRVDKAAQAGSGSIQAPAGTIRCTIIDRNTLNDTNLTSCQ